MVFKTVCLHKSKSNSLACMALALLLSACGGGMGDTPVVEAKTAASSLNALPALEQTQELLKKGAQLNSAELARAAEAVASQTSAKAGTKATASANLVTVYRFYNSQTTAHFYTASETEKATVLATLPQFSLDGAAFSASGVSAEGLSPVYRFLNPQTGVHFYTISEDEKTLLQGGLSQFTYEGIAYYASKVAVGLTSSFFPAYPLYRFLYASKGFHLYSFSPDEAENIINTLPQYHYEGIGYFVMAPSAAKGAKKLPHTGITDQQCYQAGSNVLVACNSAGATALNNQQDGHRTAVNPMSYSEVPKAGGGTYARTECLKDDVTGLIWEGKIASGLRAGGNLYTNYDDATQLQRYDGSIFVNPTLAEINAASNSVGYKNYVNSIALCGYTDWRLPTADELQGILHYGIAEPGPIITIAWFPNALGDVHWSSSPYVGAASKAWDVKFNTGEVDGYFRSTGYAVRLLRTDR